MLIWWKTPNKVMFPQRPSLKIYIYIYATKWAWNDFNFFCKRSEARTFFECVKATAVKNQWCTWNCMVAYDEQLLSCSVNTNLMKCEASHYAALRWNICLEVKQAKNIIDHYHTRLNIRSQLRISQTSSASSDMELVSTFGEGSFYLSEIR